MGKKNGIILDYSELKKVVEAHRTLGHKIICTVGSWDMLHIGHLRYLRKAKEQGDVLVVGTDSDRGIKLYKNELRPIIPQEERMEMLSYQDCVDYVTLINDIDDRGNWHYELIKIIKPDLFITTDYSYSDKQIKTIQEYSKEVLIFPRQAEKTSSTEIIERTVKKHLETLLNNLHNKNERKTS
ncbi:MAG: adenylyltransferase/cytidyltransferase family protein [Candidatus Nealsonbacteria bacterium]|nr:adenylyltransferase/cytidyltransferase family protein [Candidatus Nealsonbacteria bacterium]